jgi:long-chain acyl-CoA synthetase
VLALAAGFETLGLGPGKAMTVVGDNRSAIYFAMLAANALRAFPAPVFPDVPVAEFKLYVRHGHPDIALAEDQEQVDKLLEFNEQTGRAFDNRV